MEPFLNYVMSIMVIIVLLSQQGYTTMRSTKLSLRSVYQKDLGLSYLKKFNGRNAQEVNLFNNNLFSRRLRILINDRFTYLKNTWVVETPIEVKNNLFIAWGCKQHYCDSTNFIIVVDFKKNVVYCGIRENDVVKTYSEDGSTNLEISKWANWN